MEGAHTVQQYLAIYKYHKAHPKNQQFVEENHKNLVVYAVATKAIPERYCSLLNTKKLSRLDDLAQKNALMFHYENNKAHFVELARYRRNYKDGIEKRMISIEQILMLYVLPIFR